MDVARQAGWSPQRSSRAAELATVTIRPDLQTCPICGSNDLTVLKSQRRIVTTLAEKTFLAREIILRCASGKHEIPLIFRGDELAHTVAPGMRFGWDLVVYVGMQRYQELRQREEIQRDLWGNHGIEISVGSISALCDLFLQRLEGLHIARAPELAKELSSGYALHIDSTSETGKGGLFVCFEGVRGWVLSSAKIATENSADLKPIINKVVDLFGDPVAVMRDMSKACRASVNGLVERGVLDLICHFHFIANVGRNLLSRPYSRLEARLKVNRVTDSLYKLLSSLKINDGSAKRYTEPRFAALLYWLLKGEDRAVPSFPFGLPAYDFLRRIQNLSSIIDDHLPKPWTPSIRALVERLEAIVDKVEEDPHIDRIAHEINQRKRHLDDLRGFLRLESKPSRFSQPLLPHLEAEYAEQIRAGIDRYIEKLERRCPQPGSRNADNHPKSIILTHLKRYRDNLVGHPVITDSDGNIIGVVQRTNNGLERHFGTCRQHLRRRTGRKLVRRDLDEMPSQALLVSNLKDPLYVRILCGSLDNLPSALAAIDDVPTPLDKLRSHPDASMRNAARAIAYLKAADLAA
jgi:hypothetical protein